MTDALSPAHVEAIACLQRIADVLSTGSIPSPASCRALDNALDVLISETAAQRRKERNDLFCEYARQFCPGLRSNRAKAKRISTDLARYRASSWKIERAMESSPTTPAARVILYRILKLSDAAISDRRIRTILGRA